MYAPMVHIIVYKRCLIKDNKCLQRAQFKAKKTKICFNSESQDHEVNQCRVTREYFIKSTLELRRSRLLAVPDLKRSKLLFIENENGLNF